MTAYASHTGAYVVLVHGVGRMERFQASSALFLLVLLHMFF
jgi:hypothetical protein